MVYEKFAAGLEEGLEKIAAIKGNLASRLGKMMLPPEYVEAARRWYRRPKRLFDKEWEKTFVNRAAPIISDVNKLK